MPELRKLRAALVDMNTDEQGRTILSMLKLDGFAVEDEALFDKIAAKMAIVRAAT